MISPVSALFVCLAALPVQGSDGARRAIEARYAAVDKAYVSHDYAKIGTSFAASSVVSFADTPKKLNGRDYVRLLEGSTKSIAFKKASTAIQRVTPQKGGAVQVDAKWTCEYLFTPSAMGAKAPPRMVKKTQVLVDVWHKGAAGWEIVSRHMVSNQ